MRWAALILMTINVALWFAPGWVEPDNVVLDGSGVLPRVISLKPDSPEASTVAPGLVCVSLGWFESPERAASVGKELGRAYRVESRAEELPPLHWVLIPPQPDEAARNQFRSLAIQGVESYIVAQGEYRNAISLGLFESLQAAESVLAEKKAANLNVVLAKFPRNRIGYALVFDVESGRETETVQAVEAETGIKFDLIESKTCEGVATPEKNP